MVDTNSPTPRDLAELYVLEVHELFDKSNGIPSYFGVQIQTFWDVLSRSISRRSADFACQFEVELSTLCSNISDVRQRWAQLYLYFRIRLLVRIACKLAPAAIQTLMEGVGCGKADIEEALRSVGFEFSEGLLKSERLTALIYGVHISKLRDASEIPHEIENALIIRDFARAEALCKRWIELGDDARGECVLAQLRFVAAFESDLVAQLPSLADLSDKSQKPYGESEERFRNSVYGPIESLLWDVRPWKQTTRLYSLIAAFCCTYQCTPTGANSQVSQALAALRVATASDQARTTTYAPLIAACYERLGRVKDAIDSWSQLLAASPSNVWFAPHTPFQRLLVEKLTNLRQITFGPRDAEQFLSSYVERYFMQIRIFPEVDEAELRKEGMIGDGESKAEFIRQIRRELPVLLGQLPTQLAQLREALGDEHGACAALRMQSELDPLFQDDVSHRLLLKMSEVRPEEGADIAADRAFEQNPDQMNGLSASIAMHWQTLRAIDERAARSWVYGVHLLVFAHQTGFQSENAEHAITAFYKAVELQLRSSVFLPFRSWVRNQRDARSRIEVDYASQDGRELRRFVLDEEAHITLGQMMHVARRPRVASCGAVMEFQKYVENRDPEVLATLSAARFREMAHERNKAVHDSISTASVDKCRSLCAELLERLVLCSARLHCSEAAVKTVQ